MWPFLYQVPASVAALLNHFEQQTGHLSSPQTLPVPNISWCRLVRLNISVSKRKSKRCMYLYDAMCRIEKRAVLLVCHNL